MPTEKAQETNIIADANAFAHIEITLKKNPETIIYMQRTSEVKK